MKTRFKVGDYVTYCEERCYVYEVDGRYLGLERCSNGMSWGNVPPCMCKPAKSDKQIRRTKMYRTIMSCIRAHRDVGYFSIDLHEKSDDVHYICIPYTPEILEVLRNTRKNGSNQRKYTVTEIEHGDTNIHCIISW